ncbi:hypothetical protein [Streptomyces sp. NPDC005799]|uniref:hypothetical protein n=1 Tax=Streptomyces sp. NPDC005799 TaxID=3154678 RepID=UPI0033E15C14
MTARSIPPTRGGESHAGIPVALLVMVTVAGLADLLALPAAIWWTERRSSVSAPSAGP